MKYFKCLLFFVFVFSFYTNCIADENKSYIGFSIGSGLYRVEGNDPHEYSDSKIAPMAFDLNMGENINQYLKAGIDLFYLNYSGKYDSKRYTYHLNNIMLSFYIFPFKEIVAFELSAGTSHLRFNGIDTSFYNGFAVSVGLGFYFPVQNNYNIGVSFKYSRQYYDKVDEVSFSSDLFYVGVSSNWF